MAKTDGRGRASQSQYVFLEDQDIFEEDERRLAARLVNKGKNVGWVSVSASTSNNQTFSDVGKPSVSINRFYQDPAVVERDAAKLRRGIKQLKSVPPPPSTTNPQFTLNHILQIWNHHNNIGELKSKWEPGLSEEQLGHDVYINRNDYVEKLEDHRQDITKCFVYNETASHITGIPALRTEQDKQLQKRNGWLQSPGSRANNLSQRKVFYSQFSNSVRTFTVDNVKKVDFLKSNSDSKLRSNQGTSLPKRALFQSPVKSTTGAIVTGGSVSTQPPSNYSVLSTSSTASSSSSSSLFTPSRSLHNQWISSRAVDSNSSITSLPVSRDNSIRRSCSKSLKFEGHVQPHDSSDKKLRVLSLAKELSHHHHEKMLWAVQTLLKGEGVVSSDAEYKSLYANIYRETTQVWLKHYENKPRPRNSSSGTCDLMLKVAKKVLPSVEQKLGFTCSSIKAKKEYLKKNLQVVMPGKEQSRIISSTPVFQNKNPDTESNHNEDVFSPEMLGVNNLCDDINAVISSLDNLPPDPGDSNKSQSQTQHISLLIPSSGKNISNSVIKDLLSAPLLNNDSIVQNSSLQSISPLNLVTKQQEILSDLSVNQLNNSIVESSVTPHEVISVLEDTIETIPPLGICYAPETESGQTTTKPLSTHSTVQSEFISSQIEFETSQNISNEVKTDIVQNECLKATSEPSQVQNHQSIAHSESSTTSVTPVSPVKNLVEECLSPSKNTVIKEINILQTTLPQPSTSKPVTIRSYKLEYCDNLIDESVLTYSQEKLSDIVKHDVIESVISDVKNLNGFSKNKRKTKVMNDNELSPKLSAKSGDVGRSKRKRNGDISSNENTPVISNKCRSSKRLCAQQMQEMTTPDGNDSCRKSRKGKLSFNENDSKSAEEEEEIMAVPLNNIEDTHGLGKEDEILPVTLMGETEVKDEIEQSNDTINQIAESSTSGEAKNIDKENDSSMENITDVDTQNWSPVLKLKRSSTNLWSSELRKKRISVRRRKDNSENSPTTSPFLDLEGPFKYRLCKRALPGEFVSAVIKEEMISKKLKKLVKKRPITKDCILVRTVQEGLELRIPASLLKNECIFFGPNKFQNMICDIIGDAINKLEGVESDNDFKGFTNHNINEALLAS